MTFGAARQLICVLSRMVGVKAPELRIVDSDADFASVQWVGHPEITVSSGLLDGQSNRAFRGAEICGVVAHEIAHVVARDGFRAAIIRAIVFINLVVAMVDMSSKSAAMVVMCGIIYCWFVRRAEYGADALAAKLVGPYGLASWLMRRRRVWWSLHPDPLERADRLLSRGLRS